MLKKLVLMAVVLVAMFATASPALAHRGGYYPTYYVDTAYTSTEYGTQAQPYNTLEEAVAAAQAQPYGAYIWTKQTDGTWAYYGYIATVHPPVTGGLLSGTTLFIVLGIASLILVLAGWFLMRRSRAQAIPA